MELFVVKHYTGDERPTIKGNGFDGLEIGETRDEAEEFIAWVNALITRAPSTAQNTEVVGWTIVDKNGLERCTRFRKQDILGGVYYTTAYVASDLAKADRDFVGCAPHRILTLCVQHKAGE